jgi:hypothetical protein
MGVSIATVTGRIAEIQSALAPPPAQPAAPTTSTSGSFASTLQQAMGSGATTAPAASKATYPAAAPGTYPHLSGDLDANPELMSRLEALAARRGEHFTITSGGRSYAEQEQLWNARGSNPFPVARPGTSRHETGNAADVTVGGTPIQNAISAEELRAAGLSPLAGDAVHVELPS